jgi:hypothetical protein
MDRRTFFGTSAAVGAALAINPVPSADAQTSSVANLLVMQIEGAAQELQKGPSGEAARRLGAALHIYAAYGRDRGIDKRVAARLRKARATDVMVNPVDELTLRGYKLPAGAAPVTTIADLEEQRLLIIKSGITSRLDAAAIGFTRGSASLDRLRPVRGQAGGPGDCGWWAQLLLMLEGNMIWMCLPVIDAIAPELCPIAAAQYYAAQIAAWYYGCP